MAKKFSLLVGLTDPIAIKRLLQDNCDSYEETKFLKELSPDELDVKRESLTNNLIQLSTMEDELTEIKESFKLKMKPLKTENVGLLNEVKTRKQTVVGMLYNYANHEEGMMETYDETGELIASRRLQPSEKQGRLFVAKAANDN